MLLHIPVAVDYFYDYLESRKSDSKDQDSDSLQVFALYIDLRMYDKICSDSELDEDTKMSQKREVAVQIY